MYTQASNEQQREHMIGCVLDAEHGGDCDARCPRCFMKVEDCRAEQDAISAANEVGSCAAGPDCDGTRCKQNNRAETEGDISIATVSIKKFQPCLSVDCDGAVGYEKRGSIDRFSCCKCGAEHERVTLFRLAE